MKKYVLASVELPIQINEDNSLETLHEFASMKILHEINSPNEIVKNALPWHDKINNLLKPQEELKVTKKEILEHKSFQPKNTSFKQKKNYKHKHNNTAKVRIKSLISPT